MPLLRSCNALLAGAGEPAASCILQISPKGGRLRCAQKQGEAHGLAPSVPLLHDSGWRNCLGGAPGAGAECGRGCGLGCALHGMTGAPIPRVLTIVAGVGGVSSCCSTKVRCVCGPPVWWGGVGWGVQRSRKLCVRRLPLVSGPGKLFLLLPPSFACCCGCLSVCLYECLGRSGDGSSRRRLRAAAMKGGRVPSRGMTPVESRRRGAPGAT
jgi:hypothetical protein